MSQKPQKEPRNVKVRYGDAHHVFGCPHLPAMRCAFFHVPFKISSSHPTMDLAKRKDGNANSENMSKKAPRHLSARCTTHPSKQEGLAQGEKNHQMVSQIIPSQPRQPRGRTLGEVPQSFFVRTKNIKSAQKNP